MIYVASPYSSPDEAIQQSRYEAVRDWTFRNIITSKASLFSPIAYCHEYALKNSLPRNAAFWNKFNFGFIYPTEYVVILCLDGWEQSVGVQAEIKLALELKKKILYLKEEDALPPAV